MRARVIPLMLFLVMTVAVFFASPARAAVAGAVTVSNDEATIDFPISITFRATFQSDVPIQSIVLEYGSGQLTCGEVTARAFPTFTPGTSTSTEWTWEMKQSGSLPPGAQVWWRWHVTDANGNETLTERKQVVWLDDLHAWQTLTGGQINLHWYEGGDSFGQELHTAAMEALQRLQAETGLRAEKDIDLYIYATFDDMRDAVLYEPGWTGGMAFPEYDIVIIGISPDNLEWGKSTEAHELTHVLVGHLTFSCLSDVPTWLNEGLAVWGEGGLDPASQQRLESAIQSDDLISLRALSAGFSEVPDKADLSYSQSYSVVRFLIEEYGKEKMTDLLIALRDGHTIDEALESVYGLSVEGLEDAWRASVGAQPRAASPNPTAQPTPTLVPTFVPFDGASLLVTPTPFAPPTGGAPQQGASPTPPPEMSPPTAIPATESPPVNSNALWLAVGAACCLVLLIVLIGATMFFVRRKNQRREN